MLLKGVQALTNDVEMSENPDVQEVKEEVKRKTNDFDEDEWEAALEANESKFSRFGDEGFVAWATAYTDFGVKIDSDYSLPGGGGSGGGSGGSLDDDMRTITSTEIDTVNFDDDEQFILRGYVLDTWTGKTRNDNDKMSFRLQDEDGGLTVSAYGDSNIENMESAGLKAGDYVVIKGATGFEWETDEGDKRYGVSVPYWAEFEFPKPEFEMKDVAKDIRTDIVNPGDFVYMSGMVVDSNFNEYEGCVDCMKKYDPDETRVCPNCGADELVTYRPGRLSVMSGDNNVTVSFAPSDEVGVDDPMFEECEVLGEWTEDDYEGTTYKEIDVSLFTIVEDEVPVDDSSDTSEVEEETEDEPEPEEPETEDTEEEDTEAESEDEDEDDEAEADDDAEDADPEDFPEEVRSIEEKVVDFGYEMPANAGIRILSKTYGIEDEDEQIRLMKMLRELPSITVNEDQGTIEDKDWQDVKLEKAG